MPDYIRINVHLRGKARELYEAIPDGRRAEFINNSIVAANGETKSQRVIALLRLIIDQFTE